MGGVTTALGFYVLASGRDTNDVDIRNIVLDIYRIVFGQHTPTSPHNTAPIMPRPATHATHTAADSAVLACCVQVC